MSLLIALFNTIALLLVTLFIFYYIYAKYKQTYWSRKGVYSPPAHWLFGHLKDSIFLRAPPQKVLGDVYKSCQNIPNLPVIGVYFMQRPFLILRDNEIIKQIFIKDFNNFSDRYFAARRKADPIRSSNIFSIKNPHWKYIRTKLSPAFSSGKQKKLFELMIESAENMKSYLSKKIPENEKIDLEVFDVTNKYISGVVASLTFGIRINSFGETAPEFFVRTRQILANGLYKTIGLFLNFFYPELAEFSKEKLLNVHEDFFRKVFWDSMNAREKMGNKRGDMIDLLLELKNSKQDSDFRFEGDNLLAQSVIFNIAGLDSSSVTISFTLKELAKHPEIQEKVRQEIREKIGNGPLTYEAVSEMTYLNQVMSETLRLYPPAPVLDRVALEDYKIPGTDILIEKGTGVYAILTGTHEDPEYHPDPLKYDPDRFSEERKIDIKPCTYLPFGEGPRMCIGPRTGMLQAKIGLITFLSEYEVFQNPEYKNEISKRAIFTAPDDEGVHVFVKRNPVCQ